MQSIVVTGPIRSARHELRQVAKIAGGEFRGEAAGWLFPIEAQAAVADIADRHRLTLQLADVPVQARGRVLSELAFFASLAESLDRRALRLARECRRRQAVIAILDDDGCDLANPLLCRQRQKAQREETAIRSRSRRLKSTARLLRLTDPRLAASDAGSISR